MSAKILDGDAESSAGYLLHGAVGRIRLARLVLVRTAVEQRGKLIGGGGLVFLTWELKQYSAVLGLPIAYVYSVIPVAGGLICFYAIAAAMGHEIGTHEESAEPGS